MRQLLCPYRHRPYLCKEHTQGSETSQYLKEKKTKVILQVAASENREAQTAGSNT